MRWLEGNTDAMNMNLGKLRDGEGWEAWRAAVRGSQRVRHSPATEKQQRLYSAIKKNEILPFVTTWTDLKDIPSSKSDKYHVILFKCGIQKQKITHKNELTDTKNRLVFAKGRNEV